MKTFAVGYIDWFAHELVLEIHTARDWKHVVSLHSKYPWKGTDYLPDMETPDAFKSECFDCDCMMNWIEV